MELSILILILVVGCVRKYGGPDFRTPGPEVLSEHAANCETVVLVVVVRRVDAGSIHVQVVPVLSTIRGTRPVVAVGASIVGAASVVVATEEEPRRYTTTCIGFS